MNTETSWRADQILRRSHKLHIKDCPITTNFRSLIDNLTFYCFEWDPSLSTVSFNPFNLAHTNLSIPAHKLEYTIGLHPNVDMFGLLTDEEKNKLRTDPLHFYVFDFSYEGTPGTIYANWHLYLHESANKNNITFNKIFYITGNLYEEEAYNQWRKKFNIKEEYHIISYIGWLSYIGQFSDKTKVSIDDTVKFIKNNETKYFLSLNRNFKCYRMLINLRLWKSKLLEKGYISCLFVNELSQNAFMNYYKTNYNLLDNIFDEQDIINYFQTLPWVLDLELENSNDLNMYGPPAEDLLKKTLFSVVGETTASSFYDTMLLFSEKTFKPMLFNHPICIFGAPNMNKKLKLIGFKTYDKYFNLDLFDDIEDEVTRINTQCENLENILRNLDSLSLNSKIEWLLQDVYTLLYNKDELKNQSYNHKQWDLYMNKLQFVVDNFERV